MYLQECFRSRQQVHTWKGRTRLTWSATTLKAFRGWFVTLSVHVSVFRRPTTCKMEQKGSLRNSWSECAL